MSKIMDHYIDRLMLIEELKSLGQDFIDAEVDIKTMAGLTAAIWHVKNFPAADIKPETRWIPVTPETMPPYELETKLYSDAMLFLKIRRSRPLILRTEIDGALVVYTGEYREGEWYVKMNEDVVAIENGSTVTHWMYAENLLEVK